jgi:hypothetical protein
MHVLLDVIMVHFFRPERREVCLHVRGMLEKLEHN